MSRITGLGMFFTGALLSTGCGAGSDPLAPTPTAPAQTAPAPAPARPAPAAPVCTVVPVPAACTIEIVLGRPTLVCTPAHDITTCTAPDQGTQP